MNKKNLSFLFLLFLLISCGIKENNIYINEFNWSISFPTDFISILDSPESKLLGKQLIEKTYNQNITEIAVFLFKVENERYNTFKSQYTVLESPDEFEKEFNQANEIVANVFKNNSDTKFEIENSVEIISGLKFKSFTMKTINPGAQEYTFRNYSRMFGNKKLDIIIVNNDNEKGNIMLNAFKESIFE